MANNVLLEWSDSLSVGIKSIDAQHRRFIGLLNKANDLAIRKKSKELNNMLSEVLNYARTHFSTEEDIFDKYAYPHSNEHKEEHLKLLEKAIKFYDKATNGEDIGEEFMVFLKDWLENHLKKHDFKYAKYFKENKILIK